MLLKRALCVFASVSTFLGVPFMVSADGTPAGIAFTSLPQTIGVGAVSEQITIQVQDADHVSAKVPTTACASLSSTSSGGEFSSSATSWSAVSVLTISKNSANRNFYSKDTVAGTPTITVKVVLKPDTETRPCASWPVTEWPTGWSATQSITVGTAGNGEGGQASTTPPAGDEQNQTQTGTGAGETPASSAPSGGSISWVREQRIFVSAKAPVKIVAGADASFEAYAVGLKKEPIENARYVWSFGDGASLEGKHVYHAYHYPGSYVVLVEASSGEWSAMDRKDSTVTVPLLSVSGIKEGPDGFIEITNKGTDDLDLSRWFLKAGGTFFMFPNGTMVKAGKAVPFPADITKLSAGSDAELLYPNGKTVVRYVNVGTADEDPVLPVSAPIAKTTVEKAPVETSPHPISLTKPTESELVDTASVSPVINPASIQASAVQSGNGSAKWFLSALALSLVVAGGYLFTARRFSSPTEPKEDKISADEFEIVE